MLRTTIDVTETGQPCFGKPHGLSPRGQKWLMQLHASLTISRISTKRTLNLEAHELFSFQDVCVYQTHLTKKQPIFIPKR